MLTPEQLLLLGIVAAILSQGWKLLAPRVGEELAKKIATIVVIVLSVALAYFWMSPELPPIDDPMEFAIAILAQASAVFGFALVIYRFLLDRIFGALARLLAWASGR